MRHIQAIGASVAAVLVLSTLLASSSHVLAAGSLATGNGAPSGPHYNLNVIGVPKDKRGGTWENNGHRIFVKLWGADTKINLLPGDSFYVVDSDGTDGTATLQLMDPYPGTTTVAVYKIYVRALGKPSGAANLTSAFVDEYGNIWYSLGSVTLMRQKGRSVFDDRTLEMTTIYADFDGDGMPERHYLFDNELWQYFWEYDNQGLKLLQIRIYVEQA